MAFGIDTGGGGFSGSSAADSGGRLFQDADQKKYFNFSTGVSGWQMAALIAAGALSVYLVMKARK